MLTCLIQELYRLDTDVIPPPPKCIFLEKFLLIFLLSNFFNGIYNRTYQVRIGPMAFEGSRHLGDNEVIHLLSGLWMISEAGKYENKIKK